MAATTSGDLQRPPSDSRQRVIRNPPRNSNPQVSGWCFTHFLDPDQVMDEKQFPPYKWFHQPLAQWTKLRYIVFQVEKCPETARLHFQGFLFCVTKQRRSTVKRFDDRVHLEPSRDHAKSIAYCQKDDTRVMGPFEYGEPPATKQLAQDRWEEVKKAVLDQKQDILSLFDKFPDIVLRYARGIATVRGAFGAPPRPFPRCLVLYGASGTGKSSFHYELKKLYPNSVYIRNIPSGSADRTFWLRYNGEPVVVFEEFDGYIPFPLLLNILSPSDCSVQVKGSEAFLVPHLLILCSNRAPHEWYLEECKYRESRIAFERRLTLVYHFTSGAPPVLESFSFTPEEVNLDLEQVALTDQDDLLYQVVDYPRLGIPAFPLETALAKLHPQSLHVPRIMRLYQSLDRSVPEDEVEFERPYVSSSSRDDAQRAPEVQAPSTPLLHEDEFDYEEVGTAATQAQEAVCPVRPTSTLERCSPTIVEPPVQDGGRVDADGLSGFRPLERRSPAFLYESQPTSQ